RLGARQKAVAGAGVADSKDATAASLNPAGLVNVGNQITFSTSILRLDGGFSSSGTGGIDPDGHYNSDPGLIVIPNFAASWRVNWGLVDAIAFAAYANGGVNTRYKDIANANCPGALTGVFCGGPLGIRLEQSFYSIAFAKTIMPGISVGVAPIVARQTGKVDGAGFFSFASSDPANFSDRGTDESWGAGARGGIEWKAAPWLRFGVAGNTVIQMSNFDRYRGLLAEQGGFDIPATLQAGVAIDLRPGLTMMLDYKRIWFGSIASVGNPTTNFFSAPFGANNGAGYGVQDVDVMKFGLEWRQSPQLTLRAGYSYNTAPIGSRDADLNIMTLGVVQHHITGGLNYQLTRNLDLELAAMYAPNASVSGVELGAPGRRVEIEMSQFEFTVGLVYRFGDGQR
ncbi:MAG: hydrocarbon degradation protein, partial [Rhodospirillales bacterium]|nr:hydrocarbon degradation protein [Rhodospirillales bacterium]